MSNLATLNDFERVVPGEALGARHRETPATSLPTEELDHLHHPWHMQRRVEDISKPEFIIKVRGATPNWLLHVLGRLTHLSRLQRNWDSYGAAPISPFVITLAVQVMSEIMSDQTPMPTIVPTTEGGVQLEWHLANIDMEVDVKTDGMLSVLYEDGASEHEPWEDDEVSFIPGFGLPQISESLQTIVERV